MSSRIARFQRLLPVGCLLLAAACSGGWSPFSSSAPAATPTAGTMAPGATLAAEPFSGERAWAHLVALSGLGPRPTGSSTNQEAREYIRSRLEELGLEVSDLKLVLGSEQVVDAEGKPAAGVEAPKAVGEKVHNLVAKIPGDSPDSILLMAHYDTLPDSAGANDGASGVAVLLELARQLSERPLPYTTEFVFLDSEMRVTEAAPMEPLFQSSDLFSSHLDHTGVFDRVRMAVVFRQVGDADLTIGRDLHSHRSYREAFFESARALGYGAAFPTDRGYVEISSSHRPFPAKGMPRILSIHDPWYGGDEPPGEFWGAMDVAEHCSAESLHTVGVVSLAGMRRITAQLTKIDRITGRAERTRQEALEAPPITGEPVEEAAEAAPEAPPQEGAPAEAPEDTPESS